MQLYVGLGASCVLLVLAIFLARKPKHGNYVDIDISGTLQVAWLLDSPHFAGVDRPNLQQLRRAGMFHLDPDEVLHRRFNRSGTLMGEDDTAEKLLEED